MRNIVFPALLCLCFYGCTYHDFETGAGTASPEFETRPSDAAIVMKYTTKTVSCQEGMGTEDNPLQTIRNMPVVTRNEVETRIQKDGSAEMLVKELEVVEKFDNNNSEIPEDDFNYTKTTRIHNGTAYLFDGAGKFVESLEVAVLNYADVLTCYQQQKQDMALSHFLPGQLYDTKHYLETSVKEGARVESAGNGLLKVTEGSGRIPAFRTGEDEDITVVNLIDTAANLLVASRLYEAGKLCSFVAYKFAETDGGPVLEILHEEDYFHSEATNSDYKVISDTYFEDMELIENLN